jgi:hypothetical protein
MATVDYKNHLIVCSAKFDDATQTWLPSILITWKADNKQELHALNAVVKGFDNSQEAQALGIEVAKSWIDRRV